MTIVIAINFLLFTLVFIAILSLKGWAVRTAHRDRLDIGPHRVRRDQRIRSRPVPAHLRRRGAFEPASAH
jgi:hypothetical protein